MNTTAPARSSRLKWIAIFLAVVIFGAFLVFCKLSPLMKVDGQNVSFLGGLIEVNERSHADNAPSVELEGTRFASQAELTGAHPTVNVAFANAQILFETAPAMTLSWDCKVQEAREGDQQPAFHFEKDGAYAINLSSVNGAKCRVAVPQGAALSVQGNNGKIVLATPRFDAQIKLNNGDVQVQPAPAVSYSVKTDVTNGKADAFPAGGGAPVYKLNLSVANGRVLNAP